MAAENLSIRTPFGAVAAFLPFWCCPQIRVVNWEISGGKFPKIS